MRRITGAIAAAAVAMAVVSVCMVVGGVVIMNIMLVSVADPHSHAQGQNLQR